jgi:hypothetical protein
MNKLTESVGGAVLAFLLPGFVSHAEPRPEPGTVPTPVQVEESGTAVGSETGVVPKTESTGEPLAAIRVWNLTGDVKGGRLGFMASNSSSGPESEGIWLARSTRPGTVGDYIALPAQKLNLIVFSDPRESFDPDLQLTESNTKDRVRGTKEVTLVPDTFWTVVASNSPQNKEEVLLQLFEDLPVPAGSFRVDAFNGTSVDPISISWVSGGKEQPIFPRLAQQSWGKPEGELQNRAGFFQLSFMEDGLENRGFVFEPDFISSRKCTLLFFYDRYGRVMFRGFTGRPNSADLSLD